MVAGTAATTTALIGGAALAKRPSVMAGDAESGRSGTRYLLRIGSLIVVPGVITDIIGVVGLRRMRINVVVQVGDILDVTMVSIGIILGKSGIHLRHESIPVHAVTVKDSLIYLFLNVPGLRDLYRIGISLGVLPAF